MNCDFEYCIYNKDWKCTIDIIEINALGMCDACTMLSLNKRFLEKEKKSQLLKLDTRWTEYLRSRKN